MFAGELRSCCDVPRACIGRYRYRKQEGEQEKDTNGKRATTGLGESHARSLQCFVTKAQMPIGHTHLGTGPMTQATIGRERRCVQTCGGLYNAGADRD